MNHNNELLLEIYCEEIPARMQIQAERAFDVNFKNALLKQKIEFGVITVYTSPCRIVVRIEDIKDDVKLESQEIKGPKVGLETQIIEKFCTSNNIDANDLFIKKVKDSDFYFFNSKEILQKTSDLLGNVINDAISSITWPKSMFWGDHKINFARPIQNIMCLYKNEHYAFQYGHIESTNYTFGHKFLSNKSKIQVKNFADYCEKIQNAGVIISRDERREIILKSIEKICSEHNLKFEVGEYLLEEVVGLVEYPNVLIGKIPQDLLSIPNEILVSAMKNHQKYFCFENIEERNYLLTEENPEPKTFQFGNLGNKFVFVANTNTEDQKIIENIISGNERVLNARLSDARYFYSQDILTSLESKFDKLDKLVFHERIGTIKDKANTMIAIAEKFNSYLVNAKTGNIENLKLSAKLCKIDLVTEVVGEFPELQGIMGRLYAKLIDKKKEEVYEAILDHYKPKDANDNLPSHLGYHLAIIDKTYDFICLIAAGERATGSKDQYGLRRLAIAIVRLVSNQSYVIRIEEIFRDILKKVESISPTDAEESIKYAISFLIDRFKAMNKESYPSLIEAIKVDKKNQYNKIDFYLDFYTSRELLNKFSEFYKTEKGVELIVALKRIKSVIPKNHEYTGFVDFSNEKIWENKLHNAYKKLKDEITKDSAKKNELLHEGQLFQELLELTQHINSLFDNALINDSKDSYCTKMRYNLFIDILNLTPFEVEKL